MSLKPKHYRKVKCLIEFQILKMDTLEQDVKKVAPTVVGYRQTALAVTVGMTFLVNSMALGFSSTAIPLLHADPSMNVSEEQTSWIASIIPGGAIFGSFISSYLVDKYGRRNLLFASMCLFMSSWIQIAISNNIGRIILARLVGGICVGLTSSSGVVYLAETIQESYRPSQGIILGIFGTSGMFLMSVLVMVVGWRGLAWVGAAVCLIPLLFMTFLPESPYYLNKLSPEKSMDVYEWILGTKLDAMKKYKQMNKHRLDQKIQPGSLFSPVNSYPIYVLFTLHTIQQLTGINVFIFFSTTLFSRIGGKGFGEFCAVVMTIINTISNLVSSLFQGRQNRTFLLLLSTRVIVPCLWVTAVFFMMKDSKRFGTEFPFTVQAIPVAAIMLYVAFFAIGWGPVPFLFMGEGLPSDIRGNATGKAMALNWASAFLVTKSFLWFSGYIGYGWMFIIYSMFITGGGLVMDIYMPETLGKSASEMDDYYVDLVKES